MAHKARFFNQLVDSGTLVSIQVPRDMNVFEKVWTTREEGWAYRAAIINSDRSSRGPPLLLRLHYPCLKQAGGRPNYCAGHIDTDPFREKAENNVR